MRQSRSLCMVCVICSWRFEGLSRTVVSGNVLCRLPLNLMVTFVVDLSRVGPGL